MDHGVMHTLHNVTCFIMKGQKERGVYIGDEDGYQSGQPGHEMYTPEGKLPIPLVL